MLTRFLNGESFYDRPLVSFASAAFPTEDAATNQYTEVESPKQRSTPRSAAVVESSVLKERASGNQYPAILFVAGKYIIMFASMVAFFCGCVEATPKQPFIWTVGFLSVINKWHRNNFFDTERRKMRRNQRSFLVLYQRSFLVLLLVVACMTRSCLASSLASSSSTANNNNRQVGMSVEEKMEHLGLQGMKPDPFVAASPLIVAAVCSDGIAMIAAHTVAAKEKLLRDHTTTPIQENDKDDEAEKDDTSTGTSKESSSLESLIAKWRDLQKDHGPHRINIIDRFGTFLLSAGWRADCELLMDKIRSMASKEVAVFGPPKWGLPYGRMLATEASHWMAQCSVSEHVRNSSSSTDWIYIPLFVSVTISVVSHHFLYIRR